MRVQIIQLLQLFIVHSWRLFINVICTELIYSIASMFKYDYMCQLCIACFYLLLYNNLTRKVTCKYFDTALLW